MAETTVTTEVLEALVKKRDRQLIYALKMIYKMNALFDAIKSVADREVNEEDIDYKDFTIGELADIGKQFCSNSYQPLDMDTSEEIIKDFELMIDGGRVH